MKSFLVIGAGVIGLATAYRLAKLGQRVTLVDRATPGSGATLASLGALWPSRPSITGPMQNLQRQSLWSLHEFLRQLEFDAARPIHFHRGGHLEILTSLKAAADAQRDAAIPTDWPTFGHAHPLEYLAPDSPLPAPIIPDTFGVLHSHVTAQVDVPSLVAALVAACQNLGVTILESRPVTGLTTGRGADTVTAARTDLGDLPADLFLVTAGAWTPLLDPLLAAAAPTRPVKGQAIEVLAAHDVPQLIMRRDKTYIVPWGRTCLIGSTTEKTAGYDITPDPAAAEKLLASAQAFCPALAGATLLRTWAGSRPDAPKHRPLMGRVPNTTNLFVAAGHYKTGIALAPLVSACMAALLLGNLLPADLVPFAPKP